MWSILDSNHTINVPVCKIPCDLWEKEIVKHQRIDEIWGLHSVAVTGEALDNDELIYRIHIQRFNIIAKTSCLEHIDFYFYCKHFVKENIWFYPELLSGHNVLLEIFNKVELYGLKSPPYSKKDIDDWVNVNFFLYNSCIFLTYELLNRIFCVCYDFYNFREKIKKECKCGEMLTYQQCTCIDSSKTFSLSKHFLLNLKDM